MVTTTLDVQGCQVQAGSSIVCSKKVIGKKIVQKLVNKPCTLGDKSSEYRIRTTTLNKAGWCEESINEIEWPLGERVVVFIESVKERLYLAVSKAIGSSGEGIGDAWVGLVVVSNYRVVQDQLTQSITDDEREVVFVRDFLDLCDNNLPRLLKESLFIPLRVEGAQGCCNSVVLSHPYGVHDGETRLLVHPQISSQVALIRSERFRTSNNVTLVYKWQRWLSSAYEMKRQ